MLTLHDVYNEDGPGGRYIRYLYDLLKERNMDFALSHERLPRYEDHVKFVWDRPYKAWYIIVDDESGYKGSIYLTDLNEIGVYIQSDLQRRGTGSWAVNELMRIHGKLRYFANIHPDNLGARAFFERQGFGDEPFQITLEKDTRDA